MEAVSKDTFYGDAFSTVEDDPLVSSVDARTWDTEKEVLWGWNDTNHSPASSSLRDNMSISADTLPSSSRKYKSTDNGALQPPTDESDGELTRVSSPLDNSTTHMRSASVPIDLAAKSECGSEDNEEHVVNGSSYSHKEHMSSSTLSREFSVSSTNGRQSPIGRPQTNGRQSPNGRPNTLPNTPRSYGADRSLSSSQNKKKSSSWFSVSYKQKSEEFHKLFKDIPAEERLLVDYSCAMQKDLLVHGRLYISQNWICFYANILFKWETTVVIPCKEIKSITKEKTARVIPNAIQINTLTDKFFFSSFTSRDKTYLMMFRVWQNVLMEQPMSNQQLWQWVHQLNGSQLGLTASDDDYPPPDSAQDSDPTAHTPADISSLVVSENTVGASLFSTMTTSAAPTTVDGVNGIAEVRHHKLSSDYTDTTEDDDCDEGVEGECPDGHEHSDWLTLDLVVNFSVDQLFERLFSDNAFFRSFLDSQGTTDIVLGPWSEEADSEGVKHRSNTFTVALNASFGPKTTASFENQKLQKETKPGTYYCIDCESLSDPSLPYGDNFYIWNRYCIKRLTKNTCRVTARSKICYRKSVFALAKAIIEKNVRNGVNGYFKPLAEALAQESNRVAADTEQPRKKKRFTRHRAAPHRAPARLSNGALPSIKPSVSSHQHAIEANSVRGSVYLASTVRVMSALLIFLVMFNLLLFFKLWGLESRHEAMQYDNNVKNTEFYSHQDILDLLNKQKYLYEKDLQHWKSSLESSTALIKKLQHSIEGLKSYKQLPSSIESPEEVPDSNPQRSSSTSPNSGVKTDL